MQGANSKMNPEQDKHKTSHSILEPQVQTWVLPFWVSRNHRIQYSLKDVAKRFLDNEQHKQKDNDA